MASGEVRYEIFSGELLGSWDSRISVVPKYEDYEINSAGRPVLRPCEPYIVIEASVHKVFNGHNVYGGATDFQQACSDFVVLLEQLLQYRATTCKVWTVHRVDVALVYRLSKPACKEFFDGMQLINFPRRKKDLRNMRWRSTSQEDNHRQVLSQRFGIFCSRKIQTTQFLQQFIRAFIRKKRSQKQRTYRAKNQGITTISR
jgi:II/X family phage/plasmid replication protein